MNLRFCFRRGGAYDKQWSTRFIITTVSLVTWLICLLRFTVKIPVVPMEERLGQRESRKHPLETIPITHLTHGKIPNTPLASSTIAFLLGGLFALGTCTFLFETSFPYWWMTYQLGYFIAAWAFFHWGEFAVTAGWNYEKCSVDCMYVQIFIMKPLIDIY